MSRTQTLRPLCKHRQIQNMIIMRQQEEQARAVEEQQTWVVFILGF